MASELEAANTLSNLKQNYEDARNEFQRWIFSDLPSSELPQLADMVQLHKRVSDTAAQYITVLETTLATELALKQAQRDALAAALKPLVAVWRGYEEYRAYFDDKHEFWDAPLNILDWLAIDARPETAMPMQTAFLAAADALAQQEGGDGE